MSSDSERELFGGDDGLQQSSDVERMDVAREPVRRHVYLKRHAPSHRVAKGWIARVPAFLRCDPQPFDAARFRETNRTNEDVGLEANALRWRYAGDQTAQKVTRVSNARIVEWSDGSRTLQLGSEHFEIRTHQQGEPAFVCEQDEAEGVLATRRVVTDTMTFLPTSTSSATHRLLAREMARRQASGNVRVGSVDTVEDPDKAQREIERAEQMKDKARRRLAAQRDEIVSYTDRSERAVRADADDEAEEQAEDEEEDEAQFSDDSVVDMDEDELAEQASRLQQIKGGVSDEEAEEVEEAEAGDAREQGKPRRMVDDDSE